jgi:ABC-2 type transport system ATP-binding protein
MRERTHEPICDLRVGGALRAGRVVDTRMNRASASEEAQRAGRPAIEVDDLTKVYPAHRSMFGPGQPEKCAVDHVTLRVDEGEIFGLVGPNGAGKTTLIRMLSTMVLPTSGTARIGGYDVMKSEKEARGLVGVVSSNERSFYWRLTGRENLRFFTRLHQMPDREADPWRDELIERLGLGRMADRRFDHYSTGEKQRMAIARGLLGRPKVLLMDEPTKGVDPVGAAEIVELIQGPVRELWNPTILVTSHNLAEIERLCGRVALMHRGRIAALGAIDELRASVRRADSFTIVVSGVDHAALERLTADAGGFVSNDVRHRNDCVTMEVSFPLGSAGFPRLVRRIVGAGGDLVSCSSRSVSFEEAFHAVVEASEVAAAGDR